jgi:hypothetical protein
VAESCSSDERFEQPGGVKPRRERERKERRARGFIGEVLKAIYLREIKGVVTPAGVTETERRERLTGGR